MKRKITLLLTAIILTALIIPCYHAIRDNKIKKETIVFCNEVAELNRKNQSLSIIELKDEYNNNVNAQYEHRLIVKTSKPFKHNADEAVIGPRYCVLQYSSKEALNEDYKSIIQQDIPVEKDYVLYANISGELNAASTIYGGSYNYCGMDYAKQYFDSIGNTYDDIVVGVVDTGIYYYHNIYNGRYIENNVNFSTTGNPDDVLDDQGHGTATSSIVLMSTPENVKVKGYKVLNSLGSCTYSDILALIEYIIVEDDKPDIINMSLGGYELTSDASQLIDEALGRLIDEGVTVCVAAGNEYVPAKYNAIAGSENAITVASCNASGRFSDFSDYGEAVDITAPGEEIYCAKSGTTNTFTSQYMTGTSVAAPFVSAACAYVKMQHPQYTPQQIKDTIKESAVKVSPDEEYYFGSGILNCVNLIDKESSPEISLNYTGGEYEAEELDITFSTQEQGDIYYTLNGGLPQIAYTGESININENTNISYALCNNGEYVSDIFTQSYIFNYIAKASDVKISLGIITEVTAPDRKINLIIPDGIDGKKPTSVALNTFNNKNYNKVTLPTTITTLGTGCFNSSKITELTATGVTKFSGDSVFKNCIYLKQLNMPNLETITESAFSGCVSLNFIDFGENIKKLQTSAFASTAIINADFPNAEYPLVSCTNVFYNARIFTCNLPKIDTLNEGMFYNCGYLYELNTKPIKTIYANALRNTAIKEMDLSELKTLYKGALSGVSIENFYAPKVTEIAASSTSTTTTLGAKFTQCETINLPNLSTSLTNSSLYYSTVKNLILPKVTAISSSKTFYNMPLLKYVYLPNATSYASPAYSIASTDELLGYLPYCVYSNPKLIFVPCATEFANLTFKDFGAIYATSASELNVTITDTDSSGNIIVSDRMNDNSLTVECEGACPNVIAPEGISLSGNFNLIRTKDCSYEEYEDGLLTYSCSGNEFTIPFDYISELFTPQMINKDMNTTHCLLFDFHDDNIINAKDYAIFSRIQNDTE